jgi:hypothetical protein
VNKPLNEFYSYLKKKTNGEEYMYYPPYCKKCSSERSNKYQKENKEQTKEYSKEIYRRKEQYFKHKAKKWSRENKEKHNHQKKRWQQNNPDKLKKYRIQRMTEKKHEITDQEWEQCKEYFNNECAYCGLDEERHKQIFKQQLHRDHVNPDGANDISNCIPSCKSCNSSKHDYQLEDWYSETNENYTIDRFNKILNWLKEDYLKITI